MRRNGGMVDEIAKMMSEKIDRQIMDTCFNGTANTFSNQQESTLTREAFLEAMAELEMYKSAPPPIRAPIRVFKDIHMTETVQYRFPKKRKNRRWTKKFKKKYSKTVPSKKIYFDPYNNNIYCHPIMIPAIRETAARSKIGLYQKI